MEYPVLILIGAVAGFFSSLLGIGGGFIIVPVFFLIGIKPSIAGGSSLAITSMIALVSSINYQKHGNFNKKAAIYIVLGGLPGAAIGTITVHILNGTNLLKSFMSIGFLVLVVIMLIRMLYDVIWDKKPAKKKTQPILIGVSIGFFVSFVSVIMGIGGGFAYMPSLLYIYGMPIQVATGTSLFIIFFVNLIATIENIFLNHTVSLLYVILTLAGSFLGVKAAHKTNISSRVKKLLFVSILFMVFAENLTALIF